MSDQIDDSNRYLRIVSPLGGDLGIRSVECTEEISRLSEIQLDLVSNNVDVKFDDIVGQRISVELDLADGTRYFDGFVTEFRFAGVTEHFTRYQATVRPWLWFLTRTADCRIFQQGQDGIKTVPDIIKSVFRDNGMVDFDDRLKGSYRDWVYCVQYRETDFNFVTRLMEQEGIYYYFVHEKGKHILVLADDTSTHKPLPKGEKVTFMPAGTEARTELEDFISHLVVTRAVQPGSYAIKDYNFEKPKLGLLAKVKHERPHAHEIQETEIFDYPGVFNQQKHGDAYVKMRMNELQGQHERVQVTGQCRFLAVGRLVTLEDHPREDQNREYLVMSSTLSCTNAALLTDSTEPARFSCSAEFLDKREVFRPPRKTRKPIVQGCQTGQVVGPPSEEIYCDEHGRVKVQFHWDRYGKRDENSSCWIRVSQAWAGKEWGGIHIPRIGQEVIVSFLEGDPDQPIITGRVYNADHMPPYGLPQNKTQSGIKSRSTKGGGADDFNEIRFEDEKDKEEIYIHAEKNMTQVVENNLNTTVYNKEDREVQNLRNTKIGKGDNKRPEETIEALAVLGQRLTTVYGNDGLTVLEGSKGRKVHIQDGNYELKIDKGDYKLEVALGNKISNVKTGKSKEEALQAIELKVGSNSITIEQAGIKIKGLKVEIEGMAMIKASAPATTVEGQGMLDLKGGLVKIN